MGVLTNAQICTLVNQIAKTPGYTSQVGQVYNAVLEELAQNYDFDIMKVTNFSITTNSVLGQSQGPYNLPTNYLRACKNEVNYIVSGEPFVLIQISISEWRALFEGSGVSDYPINFATDFSTVKTLGFPQAYLWPPANGAYVIQWPYFAAHTPIVNAQNDTNTPWFPSSTYLYTRVAGEMMKLSDDSRYLKFIGDGEHDDGEAGKILRKYLKMKDDPDGYVKTVELDRRTFRSPYRGLRATKSQPL